MFNNRRQRSTYCTIEANYWETRSIARPLCDSRATCVCTLLRNGSQRTMGVCTCAVEKSDPYVYDTVSPIH